MNKLFLLDAYALVYRAYYAFIRSPRINSKGKNTSAILGFCNTLHEVLSKEHPTHLGVAFDPHGPTFRHELFPQYKAQRQETPEDIRYAVPVIKDILRAMHIPVIEVPGFEADDVIGTLALRWASPDTQVYMLTPDKDYGQLVGDNRFIYRPRHGGGYEVMGEAEVCAKYNLQSPIQVIDLLGLMGDSSDNFPGCPGVGEKTAQKLIGEYGSIENMLKHTSEMKGALRTKLETHVDDINLSYRLATIRTDVPVEIALDDLHVVAPDVAEVTRLFEELEFRSLLSKFVPTDVKPTQKGELQLDLFAEFATERTEASENRSHLDEKTVPHTYKLAENEEEMREVCKIIRSEKSFVLDTETTSRSPMEAELVGMSFAVAPHEAWYVPVPADRRQAQHIVDIFRPAFEDPEIEKVGQNIKYDIIVLMQYGVRMDGPLFDTMVAHYLIQPETRHNMDYMALTLLNYQTIPIEQLIGEKGRGQKSMRDVAAEQVVPYACEDADITLQLKHVLAPRMEEAGVTALFHDIEMPLVYVLAEMEFHGVRVDTHSLSDISASFTQRLSDIERRIYTHAGETFNIASPKQVGDVLFEKLHIADKAKKTSRGQYVTSEEVLQQLRGKHPIVGDILSHRALKKLLGTYVDALPKLINSRTGHIHTSFNQTVTATGRLSSSDPNLQNIPIRGEDGKEIRRAFVPDEGCLFFSADYSQIELRIMAHLSEDPHLLEAFRQGHDIHAATAARIYKKRLDEVTRDERTKAKRANFGIIYGITVFGLAERLDIERSEAKALIDGYFDMFPRVYEYMERVKAEARQKGWVDTLFHRRRYLPDINSHNATVRNFAERNAINAPIQGSAADIIKIAMIRIRRRFMEEHVQSQMILQVHDELNFSVCPGEQLLVESIVREEMEGACALHVPLVVDCGWGKNWLEAH
ncbi:MAG: DNA polymerase I [Bacteroidaceae bacterium]|nr:DNA polymerase I [Bacteroidaceae bacterium]